MNAIVCGGRPKERNCIRCLCFIQCCADQAIQWQRGKDGNRKKDLVEFPGRPSLLLLCSHGVFRKQVDLKHILPNYIFLKKESNILGKNFMIHKKDLFFY